MKCLTLVIFSIGLLITSTFTTGCMAVSDTVSGTFDIATTESYLDDDWNTTIGDGGFGDGLADICVHSTGVYVVGTYNSMSPYNTTMILAKYGLDGSFMWSKNISRLYDPSSPVIGEAVAIGFGQVWALGSVNCAGDWNLMVTRYTFDGAFKGSQIWGKTARSEFGADMVIGTYYTFIVGSAMVSGKHDTMLALFNDTGLHNYDVTFGDAANFEDGTGIALDEVNDAIYVCSTNSSGSDQWMQVMKTDTAFRHKWTSVWNSPGDDIANSISIDKDNIYVAGDTDGASATDASLVSWDTAGVFRWNRTWGGTLTDNGKGVSFFNGGIYMAGETDSGAGPNAFVAKYDADGNTVWSGAWGGGNYDFFASVWAGPEGLFACGQSNSFTSGIFQGITAMIHSDTATVPELPTSIILAIGSVVFIVILYTRARKKQDCV